MSACLRFCCCCFWWFRKEEDGSEYARAEGDDNMSEQTPLLKGSTPASPAPASSIATHMFPPPDRAFIIAQHQQHGILLLKAFKKRKGIHYQLPGGHIDSTDNSPAAAAARELFEETGVDIRSHLERLSPLVLPNGGVTLKGRTYFRLELHDDDSCGSIDKTESATTVDGGDADVDEAGVEGNENGGIDTGAGAGASEEGNEKAEVVQVGSSLSETGEEFFLQLSHEHTGFRFVRSINQAAELTMQHSGGCSSHALLALRPESSE